MASDSLETKRRALGLLLIEIENLRQHGFSGLLCIGANPRPPADCSADCPLLELAPPESRTSQIPCRQIPLNEQGETVESIAATRATTYLEEQLTQWMEKTARQLKRELRETRSD
jgi:hypothetical protein